MAILLLVTIHQADEIPDLRALVGSLKDVVLVSKRILREAPRGEHRTTAADLRLHCLQHLVIARIVVILAHTPRRRPFANHKPTDDDDSPGKLMKPARFKR
jgi:hypothetical protein